MQYNKKKTVRIPAHSVSGRRKKQRRRHGSRILYYLLAGLLSAAVLLTLSLTVFFRVEAISVEGGGDLPRAEILELSGLQTGQNLWRMNLDKAEKAIMKAYPTVEKVEAHRRLPDTVVISIQMAEPVCLILREGNYYSISTGGRILKQETTPAEIWLPVILDNRYPVPAVGDYLPTEQQEEVSTICQAISENPLEPAVTLVDTRREADMHIYLGDLYRVDVGGLRELSYKLSCVNSIIQQKLTDGEKGIIDAAQENGNYYFRPYDWVSPTHIPSVRDE